MAEAFDAMTPAERYSVMRDTLRRTFRRAEIGSFVAETIEALRYVSDNFEEIGPSASSARFASYVYLRERRRDSPWLLKVLAAIDDLIEENRAAGRTRAELTFMSLKASPDIDQEPIFSRRAVLRRAAELGLLADPIASETLEGMGRTMRSLVQEGRHEEAVRAGTDTLIEFDTAGVEAKSWLFFLGYAEALSVAGLADQSAHAFRRAFEAERAYSGKLGDMQLVLNQWSYYLNILGRFTDAEEPGLLAANLAVEQYGRANIATQKARYNYAVALLGQGKADQALPYFEEALPLQRAEENELLSFNSRAGRKADTVLLLTTLARARLLVEGRERDALPAAMEAADMVRALRDERLRGGGQLAVADPGAAALAKAIARGERRDPLSPAFDMVMLTGWLTGDGNSENIDSAFRAAQDLTLNEAGSAISQAAARDLAGDGALGELVRQRQDTAAQIVRLNGDYRTALTGSDPDRVTALRGEIDALGEQLAALDARLDAEFPEYGDLVAPRSVTVDAVRGVLRANEALLMLLPSEGHHYVFALTSDQAVWHRVEDGAAETATLIERLRCRMDEATCTSDEYERALLAEEESGPQPIDANYPRYDLSAARRLYELLIAPVESVIAGKGVVYTVAAGPVAGLPLSALVTGQPDGQPEESGDPDVLRDAPWLGNRHAFVTLPSVSAITLPRPSQEQRASGFVGYGAPVLLGSDGAGARGAGDGRRRGGTSSVRAASLFTGAGSELKVDPEKLRRLDPLPGTERELAMLARSLKSGEEGLRLGEAATETAVKRDSSLSTAAVVVFATHGLLPGEMGQAAEPGLVLTPPASADGFDDGLLTASEAAELSLAAQWLILSACNTASPGGEQGAEALSGLARAFLYAGAGSLLASHWRVSDDASAELTVQTITAGQSGRTQAQALQAGQAAVRTGMGVDGEPIAEWKPHWAHPAAWAPFTLITDHDRRAAP